MRNGRFGPVAAVAEARSAEQAAERAYSGAASG